MNRKKTYNRKRKKLTKRIISLCLSFAMLLSVIYTSSLDGVFNKGVTSVQAAVSPDNITRSFTINSLRELYDYSNNFASNPSQYNNMELTINIISGLVLEENHEFQQIDENGDPIYDEGGNPVTELVSYIPLGKSNAAFNGKVVFNQTSGGFVPINGKLPLFDTVYDSVGVYSSDGVNNVQLSLNRIENIDEPLFARRVLHDSRDGSSPATWYFTAEDYEGTGYSSSGLIGTIGANTSNDGTIVNIDYTYNSTASISSAESAGLICGKVNQGASVNVTLSGTNNTFGVTSSGGNAGSLAGEMYSGSSMTVTVSGSPVYDLSASRTISGSGYAGGLVGYAEGADVAIRQVASIDGEGNVTYTTVPYTALGTISAGTAAGGIFGYYKATSAVNWAGRYSVGTDSNYCNVGAKYAGGYVGDLVGNNNDITFTGTVADPENNIEASDLQVYVNQSGSAENFGGLVGRYTASSLTNSFNIIQTSVHAQVGGSFTGTSYYGGAIGSIYGNTPAYVKVDNFTINAETGYASASFFGGAVGNAGDAGSMLDIGTISVTTGGEYVGGGVVGRLNKGVLRLSGITDLSDAASASGGKSQGQIVGYRTDALVYALGDGSTAAASASYGSGWRLVRSDADTEADDIGTWGEVVRISDIEGTTSSANAALTFDGAAHTVTLKPAVKEMATQLNFTKTALNIQLNGGADIGALQFAKTDNAVDQTNKNTALLASTELTVSGTISLSGTGITGFMRDGSASNDNEIGTFTGTLAGSNSAKIELATGERYGIYSDSVETPSVGRGAIFAHKFNGLFAKTGAGAQVTGITIDGVINVNPVNIGEKINTYIGGLTAFADGGITIKGVDAEEDINCKYISGYGPLTGGMIGAIGSNCSTTVTIAKADGAVAGTKIKVSPQMTIKGSLPSNGNTDYFHAFGGLIGVDLSEKTHTLAISDVSLAAKIDASESGSGTANVSTAGLISDLAYIGNESTSDKRTLTLTDITVGNTSVINNATGTSGGILGYRWYNTNVAMDNVVLQTVTSDNKTLHNVLTTTAAHAGAIVYRATGHWTIASKDLQVKSLNITNTPSSSLGILVHDGHYNNSGIFLELTANDSFVLSGNSALTIPSMTGKVYDELCAYSSSSASTLLNNNTSGIISYHTNETFSMDESTCNSYQNVYNTTVVNPNSRYYYNVDGTNRTDPADGWKLLVWSLNRYAAANIKTHFADPFNGGSVTGTFDLNGISYYPIDVGSNVTLGDITVKFYNKEIETTENLGTTKKTTRSNTSQQYLMHSGLFKHVSATITTEGNIHFKGTVAKDGTYTGVLINGELRGGTLTTAENKEIVLEGVKLYNTSGADNSGYLLINKITNRTADGVTYSPRMVLCGVRVGEADNDSDPSNDETLYADADTTSGVAKSLIGDVVGTGVDLTFKKIRLDARKSSSADGNHYGTNKSIFTQATLLNKFDVDTNSSGVYNYSYAEDWTDGHWVTYGLEVTSSNQYSGEEKKYSGALRYYTHPDSAPTSSSSEYTFTAENYLPYVYLWNGTTGYTNGYRELRVNVQTEGIVDGCGTYNHPYEITTADQFLTVYKLLNNSSNFTSNMSLRLPLTVGSDEHWCTVEDGAHIDCALYTYNGTNFTSTATGANPWNVPQVREYLAGAYYQISGEGFAIEDNNYQGLGFINSSDSSKENYVFHGVITGKTGNEVITNKTSYPFIRVSNGSVVRNLTINVNTSEEVVVKGNANTTAFAYTHAGKYLYYGGVIGEIMGGDNIIDNVKVNYTNNSGLSLKINDNGGYLSTVGGYVGVVVNGALIFRNMSSSHLNSGNISIFIVGSDGTDNSKKNYQLSTNTNHLYINPYVGRVINGYAVNETTSRYSGDLTSDQYTLNNSTKNYQISDIKTSGFSPISIGTYTAGDEATLDSINIPDGQALFILSLITQSGAGTATTAGGDYAHAIGYDGTTRYDTDSAVKNAATHLASYNEIGTTSTADYTIAKNNDKWASKTAVPYIIYKYTSADTSTTPNTYPARTVTGKPYFIKLSNTTEKYTYNLPASFRGIGSICDFDTHDAGDNKNPRYCMKIYGMEGNGDTVVNLNLNYNTVSYTSDNYIKTVYGDSYSYVSVGFGLFNNFKQVYKTSNTTYNLNSGYYIGRFTISGSVTVMEYNNSGTELTGGGLRNVANNGTDYIKRHPVGGLVGGIGCYGYANLFKLNLSELTISAKSSSAVGGYIGTANVTEDNSKSGNGMSYFFANACSASKTKITASNSGCGGLLGVAYSGYSSVFVNTAPASEADKSSFAGSDNYYKSSMELSVSNNTDTNRLECGTGGILGAMRNGYNVKLWINNVTISGYAATSNSDAKLENTSQTTELNSLTSGVGGLIGYVRKASSVNITNCTVKNIDIKGPYAGGLFGNIAYETGNTDYGIPPKISVNNCKIYADAKDNNGNKINYSIEGVHFAGGITGQFITNRFYEDGEIVGGKVQTTNIGYDGVTNFMYDIDGCEIYGYTIAQSGSVQSTGVGGIMGNANNAVRSVVNTSVHDCTIKAKDVATHGMGGVVGYTTVDIYGYNISLYNNKFADYDGGTTTTVQCGNFLGNNNGGKVIKIAGFSRSSSVFDNGTTAGLGITVETGSDNNGSGSYIVCSDYTGVGTGNSHGTAMGSLIGEDVTNIDQGVAKNFFPYATVSSKIKMGTSAYLTGDGVSMYTRYTRQKAVDENGDYVMDGENYTYVTDENDDYVYDSNSAPMAMAVYDDRSNTVDIPALTNPQVYGAVTSDDLSLIEGIFNTDSNADVFLTTYDTEVGLPANYSGDDFPILAVGGRQSNDYTDEITAYIRLLTNTTDAYTTDVTGKYAIDILQCKYSDGNYYVYATNPSLGGLRRNSSGHYIMYDNYADTVQTGNQFTLIDVKFFNPADADTSSYEVAYHMYVPVLTKKMVNFQFFSAAMQGSDYVSADYTFGNKAAGNFDSWMTVYVKYIYPASQINQILNTGKGLNWNNEKIVEFQYGAQRYLADSTQYVLLDNNNGADKEYYLTKGDIITETGTGQNAKDVIDLSSFKTKRNGSSSLENAVAFEPQDLSAFTGKNVVYSTNANNTGNYALTTEGADDCVAFAYDSNGENIKFFKQALGVGAYDLTYTGGAINETYYISMYTYGDDNYYAEDNHNHNAYGFTITCPLTLEGNVMSKRSNNLNENANATVYLGNMFQQTLIMSNFVNDTEIKVGNNVLTVSLNSTISFIPGDDASYFQNALAANNITLFQGFIVYLNRHDDSGNITNDSRIFTSPQFVYTNVTDSGVTGQPGVSVDTTLDANAPYLYIAPVEIAIPSYSQNSSWEANQTAAVTLTFEDNLDALEDEFPTRMGTSRSGIGISSTANMEFNADRVEYSNQTYPDETNENNNRYHIQKDQKADLTLTALDQSISDGYDHFGEQSKNRSSLGINANYLEKGLLYEEGKDYEHIDIAVNFDVNQLPMAIYDGTYSLYYDVKLEQKQNSSNANGYTYSQVDIDTFLRQYAFYSKGVALTADSVTDGAYRYKIPIPADTSQCLMNYADGQFTGTLSFDVYTAGTFEDIEGYLYANYRITMTAKVAKTTDEGTGYLGDNDHIVYTNAKINAEFVSPVIQEGGD